MNSIGINFAGINTSLMASSEVAGVVAKSNWNNIGAMLPKSTSPVGLRDDAGVQTSATIMWSSDNLWNTTAPDIAGNFRMMRGYLDNGSGVNPVTVTIAGLPTGVYDIYVYADGDNASNSRVGNYALGGSGINPLTVSLTDAPATDFSGTFTRANNSNGNYVLFPAVSVSAGGFTLTATPGTSSPVNNPRSPVNAIQIIPVAPTALSVSVPKAVTVNLPATGQVPVTITFPSAGLYNLSVTVSGVGPSASAQTSLQVNAPTPVPVPTPSPVPVPSTTPDVVYPAGSGVLSVKDYGAKGDGVADDTASIRSAMYDAWNKGLNIIYFPAGTYLVSDTLWWRNAAGTWLAWLTFQGQNKATTTIKLKDNCSGFQNGTGSPMYAGQSINAKAVLYMASNQETNPLGAGESAYANCVYDITIDTGIGNPGAQAIDWCCSNNCSIRNVILKGASGRVGLNSSRGWSGGGNGPALVKNLLISGAFDYSWVSGSGEVNIVGEHIQITNPKLIGFWNRDQNVSVRDLQVSNASTIPAVQNEGNGNLTLIDPVLSGSGVAAIMNTAWLFARNVKTTGFTAAISGVVGQQIAEYGSNNPQTVTLFGGPTTSLNLPVQETPEPYSDNNFVNWAVVSDYGALPNGQDCTQAIISAFTSGKPIIFFPAGAYVISGTIHVPATVKRILGVWSNFTANNIADLQFDGVAQDFRQFSFGGRVSVFNNTSQSLTLVDMYNLWGYVNGSGNTVFIEDCAINNTFTQHKGNVWARQLDIECEVPHFVNDGAVMWCLGYKTEGAQSLGDMSNASKTEILGAFNSTPGQATYDGYHVTDSRFCIAGLSSGNWRDPVITATMSGVTKTQPNLGNRYGGTALPLFVV